MMVKVEFVRSEVLHSRQKLRIARPAVFRPSFIAEREDGNPFLGDDLFEMSLFVGDGFPRHFALAHFLLGVVESERVDVEFRGVADI